MSYGLLSIRLQTDLANYESKGVFIATQLNSTELNSGLKVSK